LSACKKFWGVWINKNQMPYFRLEWAEFKSKWRQWRLRQIINNLYMSISIYIYENSSRSHQTGLAHVFIDQTIEGIRKVHIMKASWSV
jgi:hypothetical protein